MIGGRNNTNLSFDVNSHNFRELPFKLIKKRHNFGSAFIPGTSKIIVTGGISELEHERSCEIIDTENGTVTMASPMNCQRCSHGMGIMKVNGEERLAVFGGFGGGSDFRSIELYNTKTQKWDFCTDVTMNIPRAYFGFVNI